MRPPPGLVAALSGLWLAHFHDLPPTGGAALYLTRLTVGVWMTFALCRGYLAIRSWDIETHRNWMLRGSAWARAHRCCPIGLTVGPSDTAVRAVLMGAGWVINAAIAEKIAYRRGRPLVLARA